MGAAGLPNRLLRPPHRHAGPRAVRDAELTEQITAVHQRSRGIYGAPRVHAVLKREGAGCGRGRVARLMRAAGLQGRHRRRRHLTIRAAPTTAGTLTARGCDAAQRCRPVGDQGEMGAVGQRPDHRQQASGLDTPEQVGSGGGGVAECFEAVIAAVGEQQHPWP
ncbi:IS3 family transposase [Streptomyces sp. NPDC002870]|uniref:IS3 family transposase n=1 Tax=Streptomyces sp. NPDC002870 TaxID=3364666 RepID=UPI0036A7478B